MKRFQKGLLLGSAIVAASSLIATQALSLPTSGCAFSAQNNVFQTCTLVEAPEAAEPGALETITVTGAVTGVGNGLGLTSGYVPIFESASGGAASAFPQGTNPAGVTGSVSDYLIVTSGSPGTLTLVSDNFPLISQLLTNLTQLPIFAADGTPLGPQSEPAENTFNQPVEFFLNRAGFPDQVIIYSDVRVPEPATLALFGAGLTGLGMLRRRRKTKASS